MHSRSGASFTRLGKGRCEACMRFGPQYQCETCLTPVHFCKTCAMRHKHGVS